VDSLFYEIDRLHHVAVIGQPHISGKIALNGLYFHKTGTYLSEKNITKSDNPSLKKGRNMI
jgi:hypothetical protein